MRAQVDRRTNALMASAEEGGAGMSEQHARAEAQMEALYYSGDAGHTQKFLSLASGVTGGDYSGVSEIAGDAARHQGLADQQIDTPEQRGGGAYQAIPDALNPLGSGAVTREHVREHHNQGGEEVIAQRQANDREQANSAISSILDQSSSNWSGPPTAAAIQSLISGQHNASDAAGGFADTSDSSVMKDDSGVSVLGLQVGGGAVADAVGDIASRGMSSPTAVMNAAAATGLPTDQASAFAYGAMSSDQRAQFEQAGHTAPDMSSPAGQAAYAAGASYQATGSMDSARETYDGHRQAYREQFYSQNYESQGAQLIGQGMTATSPEERQAAFEQGRSMIAREAALAEGVNYDTLGDSERVRYDQHADNVTKHAIEGFSNGDGRGALQPLARHDEIVRLSQNR